MSNPLAVVAGPIAGKLHRGGEAWVRLNWALGLRELGFEVRVIELLQSGAPEEAQTYFHDVLLAFDLSGVLVVGDRNSSEAAALAELVASADLLVNMSGHLSLAALNAMPRRAIYVDVDPGYTQCWAAQGLDVGLAGHDLYATVGLAVGSPRCALPTAGIPWIPVAPPVVLAEWPVLPRPSASRFTTVAAWRGGYGRLEHGGVLYGQKAHEFRKLIDLPRRSPHVFEIALGIDAADAGDRRALLDAGWRLADPLAAAATPDAYRRYIQDSTAELSVAQGVYIDSRCGWLSDRTALYLASGRPAIVQETGVGDVLPVGEGLVTFRTVDEAVAISDAVMAEYDRHARAARSFAEQHLDANLVLARLLDRIEPRATTPGGKPVDLLTPAVSG